MIAYSGVAFITEAWFGTGVSEAMTDEELDDEKIIKRSIKKQPVDRHAAPGDNTPLWLAVELWTERGLKYGFPKDSLEFAFIKLKDRDMADWVRGKIPETGGTPVMLIGTNFGKKYYQSHDGHTVPVDVLEYLYNNNLTLVKNIDGGWEQWGGRPEFSETHIDFRDAEVVDMAAEIEERREDAA